MNAFDFHAPGRVVFGWGRIAEIGTVVKPLGTRAFLVWGSRTVASEIGKNVAGWLASEGLTVRELHAPPGEPDVAAIDRHAAELRAEEPTRDDVIVAIGGGSGLDAGKALAGLALDPQKASIKEFLEGVGSGRKITWPVLPVVAVPTTAGTGSEATFNAVISSRDPPFKKSFRDHRLMPRVALIDPQLACSAPKHVTAWAGMDALTQLIEACTSKKSTRASLTIAIDGLRGLLEAIKDVHENPDHRGARETLALAATRSGLGLANAGLGVAHGVAAGLGALKGTPHGLACAVMLPAAIELNATSLKRAFESRRARWSTIYMMLESHDSYDIELLDKEAASNRKLVTNVRLLNKKLGIPSRLGELGVTHDDIPELVRLSQGSSLSGNPKSISEAELAALLESML